MDYVYGKPEFFDTYEDTTLVDSIVRGATNARFAGNPGDIFGFAQRVFLRIEGIS